MKLQELLIEKIDLSTSTPINLKGQQWLPISGDMVGSGVQARAYHTGQGIVTKIAVLDDDLGINDPAVAFLDIILKHQDNPFFPKIYHARVYRDKEGIKNPILVVQMEKLISITDPKIVDAVSGLFDKLGIGTKDLSGPFKQHIKRFDKSTRNILSKTSSLNTKLRDSSLSRGRVGARSQNPQFREAIKFLTPAFLKYGNDLHSGNWMVRLTGAGPQLVIIDPFAPSSTPNM